MILKLLIVFGILGLFIFGFVLGDYSIYGNEIIKRNINKFLNKNCEFRQLPNGWTQIENCALYKMKGDKK